MVIQENRLTCLHRDLKIDLVSTEVHVPVDRLSNLIQRQDIPTSGNERSNRGFNLPPLRFEHTKHLVRLPELVWGNLQAVLVDHEVVCQRQLEQV